MGRFKRAFMILFSRKDKEKQEAQRESASIRNLKRQINILEDILDNYESQIASLLRERDLRKQDDMEAMIINAFVGLLSPQEHHKRPSALETHTAQQTLETGEKLSDDQIKRLISQIPQGQRATLKSLPEGLLIKEGKKRFPGVSEESVRRAIHILKQEA